MNISSPLRTSLLMDHITDTTAGQRKTRFPQDHPSRRLPVRSAITRAPLLGNVLRMANRPVGSRRKAAGLPKRLWRFTCRQSFLGKMFLLDSLILIFGTRSFKQKRKERLSLIKGCILRSTFVIKQQEREFHSGELSNLPFSKGRKILLPVESHTPLEEKLRVLQQIERYGVLQKESTLEFDHILGDVHIHIIVRLNHEIGTLEDLKKLIDYRRSNTVDTGIPSLCL